MNFVIGFLLLTGMANCQNPFGRPGDTLWVGNELYVCSRIGTWAPK